VTLIATAQARDAEMAARIARHRAERPAGWQTVEQPLHLAAALQQAAGAERSVLIDCLTLWLLNLLEAGEATFVTERAALLECLPRLAG
jgi:adenosylcobinamide kinase / adenosylcobinamide-phosphate guanylyltransferase